MSFINQQLAGFQLEVVKTNSAGHARKLAATVDFSSCPDGISVFTLSCLCVVQFTYSLLNFNLSILIIY